LLRTEGALAFAASRRQTIPRALHLPEVFS
jgi:hypothetical protein